MNFSWPEAVEAVARARRAERETHARERQRLLDDIEHHALAAALAKNEASALRVRLADAEREIASLKARLENEP